MTRMGLQQPNIGVSTGPDIVYVKLRCRECASTFKHYPITSIDNAPEKCPECRGGRFLL